MDRRATRARLTDRGRDGPRSRSSPTGGLPCARSWPASRRSGPAATCRRGFARSPPSWSDSRDGGARRHRSMPASTRSGVASDRRATCASGSSSVPSSASSAASAPSLFFTALELATHFFLGFLVGYTPPSPAGEGGAPITDFARPWALPLVVGPRRPDLGDHRLPLRARGRGPRHRRGHRRLPPQPARHPRPHPAGQARRLRDHHRLGRIGRPRGSDGPDQRRLRVVPRPRPRPRRA